MAGLTTRAMPLDKGAPAEKEERCLRLFSFPPSPFSACGSLAIGLARAVRSAMLGKCVQLYLCPKACVQNNFSKGVNLTLEVLS